LDKTTEIAIGMLEAGLQSSAEYIQILRLAGDDMGHQSGTLVSPRTFTKLIKPRFKRLYSFAKERLTRLNPAVKLMAHTDGDVYALIPEYIEMGLDLLNPVQPGVTHMDHTLLKKQFGGQLAFHGGIDIQHLLPHGTCEEVRVATRNTLNALGTGGGYIAAPTHYLQPDVPPENILALRDALLEFGAYPLVTNSTAIPKEPPYQNTSSDILY
jgi:uroporphyrinogen decarboxylase